MKPSRMELMQTSRVEFINTSRTPSRQSKSRELTPSSKLPLLQIDMAQERSMLKSSMANRVIRDMLGEIKAHANSMRHSRALTAPGQKDIQVVAQRPRKRKIHRASTTVPNKRSANNSEVAVPVIQEETEEDVDDFESHHQLPIQLFYQRYSYVPSKVVDIHHWCACLRDEDLFTLAAHLTPFCRTLVLDGLKRVTSVEGKFIIACTVSLMQDFEVS